MRHHASHRGRLLCSAALAGLICSVGAPAQAQEQEGLFQMLGRILLGESKRQVLIETATPETVIGQEEIDDRQAATIGELIDSVPGVTLLNGSSATGSGINIRGFGANGTYGTDQKVLLLIDGATKGAEELYRIGTQLFTDPELYREVSVIRGTVGSFEYGSGVIGGVVKLETKDASDFTGGEPGFKVRETLQFSSNGTGITSSTILAWQPSEDLEFLANYTWRDTDVLKDGSGTDIGTAGSTLPSGLVKARYTFGENRDQAVTFALSQTETDERDVPYDTFGLTGGAFGNVDRQITDRTAVLTYEYTPAGNDLIDLNATLSYSDSEIFSTGVSGQTGMLQAIVDADHRYETTKLTVKNTALFETGQIAHTFKAGFEWSERERLDAQSAPGGTDERLAVFVVDEMAIGDHLTITPALRYETQDIGGPLYAYYDNEALMGGVSARYEWASGFAVFASGAYTENLPIIDDLGTPAYMTQSEKARTWELGASYTVQDSFAPEDTLSLKANLFYTDVWDITSYSGTTSVHMEGLELEGSYAMASGYYVDLNATLMRGQDTTGGASIDWDGTPADQLRLTLGRKFGQELDLGWEVVASASASDPSDSSPGSVIHNLRATYVPQQGILEGTEIRFGVENVFDTLYTPHLSTRPAPGRNIKLTLAKTF